MCIQELGFLKPRITSHPHYSKVIAAHHASCKDIHSKLLHVVKCSSYSHLDLISRCSCTMCAGVSVKALYSVCSSKHLLTYMTTSGFRILAQLLVKTHVTYYWKAGHPSSLLLWMSLLIIGQHTYVTALSVMHFLQCCTSVQSSSMHVMYMQFLQCCLSVQSSCMHIMYIHADLAVLYICAIFMYAYHAHICKQMHVPETGGAYRCHAALHAQQNEPMHWQQKTWLS